MDYQRQLAGELHSAALLRKDDEFGRQHRKTGVPPDPSQLALDESVMGRHQLLRPRELLRSAQAEALKRAALADVAVSEEERLAGTPRPHYLAETASHERQVGHFTVVAGIAAVRQLRDATRMARAADHSATKALDASDVSESGQSASEALRKKKARAAALLMPSAAVVAAEKRLVARSQAPLHFRRNPRHVPRAPLTPAAEALAVPPPPLALQPPTPPPGGSVIHPTPQEVVFTDYAIGSIYEIPLQLQNSDPAGLTRRVRVLPPRSSHFSVSLLSYPMPGGHLAAGMFAEVRVRFAPDSLADYDDFLIVQTELDSFPVPLRARRLPPRLTLPPSLDCGYCFVGAMVRVDFDFVNEGGSGRFFIIDRQAWESGDHTPLDPLEVSATARTSGPPTVFSVSPTFAELPAGAAGRFSVRFAPEREGPLAHALVLVCDNCEVKELTLTGTGCVASLQLESVGGRPPLFQQNGRAVQDTLHFDDVSVHGAVSLPLAVQNSTPLPIDFEWHLHALPPQLLPLTRSPTAVAAPLRAEELPGHLSADEARRLGFPFAVEPAGGTIAAGETASFVVHYSPLAVRLASAAAMFVPLGLPLQSMPQAGPPDNTPGGTPNGSSEAPAELGLRLLGRGVSEQVQLEPLALLAPGGASVGNTLACSFRLTNPNASRRQWRWLQETLSPEDPGCALHVEMMPSGGCLEAGETAEVEVTVCGGAVGVLRRTLLLGVSPAGETLRLPLEMRVASPAVVLTPLSFAGVPSPALDFGLMSLGETRELTLCLRNPTDALAPWTLGPGALPKSADGRARAAAEAQAAALEQDVEASFVDTASLPWSWADGGEAADASRRAVEAILHAAAGAAGLRLSEVTGILPPQSEAQVTVVVDPAAVQSMRRTLACSVRHGSTAHLGAVAEVVQRAACLSKSELDFGIGYVKVPLKGLLQLRNLTRVPTAFEFEAPETGDAELLIVPSGGVLAPDAFVDVTFQLTPFAAGKRSLLIGCSVEGGRSIGLRILVEVRGLTLSWEEIMPEDPRAFALPPLDEPHAPPAEAGEPPPLNFGAAVPIFEATTRVLLVTNHSAVPTTYHAAAAAYPAPDLAPDDVALPSAASFSLSASMAAAIAARERERLRIERRRARAMAGLDDGVSVASSSRQSLRGGGRSCQTAAGGSLPLGASAASTALAAPRLSDRHESSQPFFSVSGVNVAARRALAQREAALLSGRQGAAFEVMPRQGDIPPWGSALIAVVAHTNMWGVYNDELRIQVDGLSDFTLPMRLGVVGCPVRLHDATLGLSLRTAPPTVTWAPAPHGAASSHKTIRLTNHGPEPATVDWGVYEPPDSSRLTSARLAVASDGRVQLRVGTAARTPAQGAVAASLPGGAEQPCAFSVQPRTAVVEPGKEGRFVVSFAPPPLVGPTDCRLVAHLAHPHAVVPAARDRRGLDAATSEHPPIELALHADAIAPGLELSEEKLQFEVSPVWPEDAPCYTKVLTMRNAQASVLRFSLAVPAPFVLRGVDSSCPQASRVQHEGLRAVVSEASVLELPPRETLTATISFVPPRKRRGRRGVPNAASDADALSEHEDASSVAPSQATGVGSERTSVAARNSPANAQDAALFSREEIEEDLAIAFANGSVQTCPLAALVTKPFMQLSRSDGEGRAFCGAVSFGVHHVDCPQAVELQLSNPTEVDVHWSCKHLPIAKHVPPGMTARRAAELAAETTDRPEVFLLGQREGSIAPKRGRTPALHPLSVHFHAAEAGRYRSVFVFKVRHGASVKLELTGEATYNEEDYDADPRERHLQLMLPGTLS